MDVGLVAERNKKCNGLLCPSVVLSLLFTAFDLNVITKSTFVPFDTSSASA
jgi:hypothetical protein